jgi:hypothetical protein
MIFAIPFIKNNLAVGSLEADNETLCGGSINYGHLFPSNDTSNDLFGGIIWRTPFNLSWLGFYDEWILNGISLLIRYGEQFILRASNEKALGMPVSMSDLLTVLWDAGDLSLTFSVIENEGTLFWTNTEDRMGVGPTDKRSLIFVGGKFDILELS